jgi:hypothetical protein
MTKTCVLVPSHISYDVQLDLLRKTIVSLKEQTMKADIYLAISFQHERYKKEFDETIFRDITDINYVISSHQQYQMEHLNNLRKYANGYDLIMFCDDDDTYEANRVDTIVKLYQYCIANKKMGKYLGGFIEIIDVEMDDAPEYWCYAITPRLYNDFFDRMKYDMDLLKYDYGDMYFRNYLRLVNTNISYAHCKFDKPLYNHYKNPDSICSRKVQDYARYIKNVIILLTICMYDIRFLEEKVQMKEEEMYSYVPELDRIREIKNKLYDNIAKKQLK